MLPKSLNKLAQDFNVNTKKSTFLYSFSNEANLFYKGNTPDIYYYNNISVEDYRNMWLDNWCFKDKTIKYLNNDLECLYEVLTKVNKQIFFD